MIGVDWPLISVDTVATNGRIIAVSQSGINRLQIYDSQGKFISGFSLKGTASHFDLIVSSNDKIINCIPTSDQKYDVYSVTGDRLERSVENSILEECQNRFVNNTSKIGDITIEVRRNWLGCQIVIIREGTDITFKTNQNTNFYLLAKLLHFPNPLVLLAIAILYYRPRFR